MSATLVLVLISIALLVFFAYLATRRGRDLPDLDRTVAVIRALDVEAFRNLVDPAEEEFLRASLPAREFRRIKRERAQTALVYVKELSKASLQFARFGDAAQQSPDPVSQHGGNRSPIARSTCVCARWMRVRD